MQSSDQGEISPIKILIPVANGSTGVMSVTTPSRRGVIACTASDNAPVRYTGLRDHRLYRLRNGVYTIYDETKQSHNSL